MRIIFTLCLLLMTTSSVWSQKILQMDLNKFGGRLQFQIGDVLEFQIDGFPDWYRYTITDMDPITQELVFDDLRVHVSRITKLTHIKKAVRATSYAFSAMLGTFGAVWSAYTIYGLIVASPVVGPITVVVGVAALGVAGFLYFSKFIWKRKYKITSKRRLRIVDITIYPDAAFVSPDNLSSFSWFS